MADSIFIRKLKIDLADNRYQTFFAKQGDYGYPINIAVYNAGTLLDLTGGSASIRAVKPDGNGVQINATIGEDGSVSFDVTEQLFAVPGVTRIDLALTVPGVLRATPTFYADVQEQPTGEDIPSTPEYQELEALISQGQALIDELGGAVAIEEALERSETAAGNAEAWAVGERGGVPVPATDPTYENNAKYYAAQAADMLAATLDGTNTSRVFNVWWPLSDDGVSTRYQRLERFFRALAAAGGNLTYTLRWTTPEAGNGGDMTPLDDLAGKSAAQLCTDTTQAVADWADEDPMTWYVRFNGLSLADGTMNVLAVEGVDADFDLTGETAPVYAASLAKWRRYWTSGDYEYKSWRTLQTGGYEPYAEDVAPDGSHRPLTWHPCFPGGLNAAGGLTSGAGKKPYIRHSATQGLTAARITSPYEGLMTDCDSLFALDTWQLRHFNLENSGILEGCTSYNYQYRAAVAETGVRRVLLTATQAANLQIGSNVMIGDTGDTSTVDRNTASVYSIADCVPITAIETVTVGGTDYAAVYVDTDADFDTTITTLLSTAPWSAGDTESLPGHKDGCRYSLTAGRNPIRVQGVEYLAGAYDIGLDPLYQITANAGGGFDYAVYECRDSVNQAGSITANYVNTGVTGTGIPSGWNWVREFIQIVTSVLWPSLLDGSATTRYKSGLSGSYSAGVRCPWRRGALYHGAIAGLACEYAVNSPGNASWYGSPRLPGAGKKRGEWAA